MKFNTAYSPGASLSEPKCPKVIQRYKLNKEKHEIVLCDKEPFYERIQSFADSASLSSVLARAQMGDSSALNSNRGQFVDITSVPDTLAEVYEAAKKSVNLFNGLDMDTRKLFNDNQALFSACVANGSAADIIKRGTELRLRQQSNQSGTGGTNAGE